MSYRVDRFDFIEGIRKCHFCPKQIKVGMAHIVKDEDGKEYVSGPSCAKNSSRDNVTNPGEKVPNFTKGILKERAPRVSGSPGDPSGSNGTNCSDEEDDDGSAALLEDQALEYLRLRIEKLKVQGFRGAESNALSKYYQEWQSTGVLPEDARNHLINTSNSQKRKNERFYLERLLKCYATATYLTRLLTYSAEIQAIDVVRSIQNTLLEKYHLTDSQLTAIERIGKAMRDPVIASLRLASFGLPPIDSTKI